jgi:hypothetical protein
MAVANKRCMTCCRARLRKLRDEAFKLSFNGRGYQSLRSCSQQIRLCVSWPISTGKINNVSRVHAGVSPAVGLSSSNNKSTRYAANLQIPKAPDSVITLGATKSWMLFTLNLSSLYAKLWLPKQSNGLSRAWYWYRSGSVMLDAIEHPTALTSK